MPKVRVHNVSISLDGYAAGPNQSLEKPFGEGPELHDWMFATRTAQEVHGGQGGDEGLDDDFVAQGEMGIGATIMGRNMFGPIRGQWEKSEEWKGWWGDEPPFHHPVFVLTHHERSPIPMKGGTTFHFVTDGIEAALEQAFESADEQDVRIGGGAATVQQYLRAGLIDEVHIVIVPVLFGGGERLFDNLDGGLENYECVEFTSSPSVSHARLVRRRP